MSTKVYLAYDERMTQHAPVDRVDSSSSSPPSSDESSSSEEIPFERPSRIRAIYNRLVELEASDGYLRFLPIPCIPASREAIELCHSPEHFERMLLTATMTDDELRAMTVPDDLYFGRHTFLAARLACGGVIECVKAVTSCPSGSLHRPNRAMAIVRPPGHHAGRNEAMGTFILLLCLFAWSFFFVASKHSLIVAKTLFCALTLFRFLLFQQCCCGRQVRLLP